jgi:orotidine-5'-phosphate decarboxylase
MEKTHRRNMKMKNISPAERLIVAADFKYDENMSGTAKQQMKGKLLNFANNLARTGVYIKINSGLRITGYEIINELHDRDLKVFADLKLNDISETMKIDAQLLKNYNPDILTIMCSSGISGMRAVKEALPDTEVLGVTVLTSLKNEDCEVIYNGSVESTVIRLAGLAKLANIGGIIASPKEADILKHLFEGTAMTINTPGIRPSWVEIKADDQSRVMTPYDAIMAGADRIVVGRPITTAKDPLEALKRTIGEIEKACEQKK